MTITDLVPLRGERQRALADILSRLGESLHDEGFAHHEYAVQTLARVSRQYAPGASMALADRTTAESARERAFHVVVRLALRFGDAESHRMLSGALARYAGADLALARA